ncbi:tRNA (cytidine(34)-2'-O)-methyltransferase [Ectothiorhodospiraceae bacterium WFHF3C12]|nr:tRNA (cytidine(34)-2'-O)-methyltransferase [Ectothiorhodospiraceae bacterium WFHF3C12]
MFHVVLVEPEIPPNTGNVIRLCANTGARLHLIHPLGFEMDDRRLRRAGLDYREWARVEEHPDFETFLRDVAPQRLFALTRHAASSAYETAFRPGDALCFGPETRGLGPDRLADFAEERRLRIPMVPGSRSLNLSNSVSVVVYEAWRQMGFAGAEDCKTP